MFTPNNATGRKVEGTFDGKDALDFLRAAGVIKGEWWINALRSEWSRCGEWAPRWCTGF